MYDVCMYLYKYCLYGNMRWNKTGVFKCACVTLLGQSICQYSHVCVCMYVSMYVCVHVCIMNVYIYLSMYVHKYTVCMAICGRMRQRSSSVLV